MVPRGGTPHSATGARISVLLAFEFRAVREALHQALKRYADLHVVGMVGSGTDAVREAERLAPRVVLIRAPLSGMDGIEAARLIASGSARPGVLVLASSASPAIVRRSLEAGALGYVSRDGGISELVRGIRSVGAGRRFLGNGLATETPDAHRGPQRPERTIDGLTPAERNILRLVVDGKTNPEMSAVLGLTRRTVETYRIRLMRKLGIDSLAGLVKYAIRQGIATLE